MTHEDLLFCTKRRLMFHADKSNIVKDEKWNRVQPKRYENLDFVEHECVAESER